MQAQRTCSKCGLTKGLDDGFYANPRQRDGRMSECKECTKARSRINGARAKAKARTAREAEEARLRALSHKVCSKCKAEKPHDEFYSQGYRGDGLSCWCKPCHRAAVRASEARRREVEGPRKVSPEWTARLNRNKALSLEARDKPCIDCGGRWPAAIMHLHHRDPAEKTANIAILTRRATTREALLAEIAKCDVLCPNCHALRHYRAKVCARE